MAMQTIDREIVDSSDPLNHLTYVVYQYEKRVQTNETALNRIDAINHLFQFHKKNILQPVEELPAFINRLESDVSFKSDLLAKCAREAAGPSPLTEINSILKKYEFKYRLKLPGKISRGSDNNKLFLIKGSARITPEKLSSGERMILSTMSWLYYQIDANQQGVTLAIDNKIKILLLDEPDRHLDPKLAKQFFEIVTNELVAKYKVQVIMSTHRLDSIAFAPKDSIYMLRELENKQCVVPVSRMEAIFRMTSNIRELAAYERKVYTESVPDAQFYAGIYYTLCDWYTKAANNPQQSWYPSRRHQLTFHAVSKEDNNGNNKGDGGCKKVVDRIKTDETAIKNLSMQCGGQVSRWAKVLKLIDEPALLQTFGVVDNDYGATETLVNKNGVSNRAVILNRYSLENYCLDPFIFCSALDETRIESYIDYMKIGDDAGINLNALKTKLKESCVIIKNSIDTESYQELQESLTMYFSIILFFVAKKQTMYRSDDTKKETKNICKNILNKIPDPLKLPSTLCDVPINILLKSTSHTFSYPIEFLNLRGHTLENKLFGNDSRNHPSDDIALHVFQQGVSCIPQDLMMVFQQLDFKVRENVRMATKPRCGDKTKGFFAPLESESNHNWQTVVPSVRNTAI